MNMDLATRLETLGLSQYASVLHENGFDDWDTVLDITEEDLDSLAFKRGHRRILQREIALARSTESSPENDTNRSPTNAGPGGNAIAALDGSEKRTKRRYRWHPRPDPNAPKKPKTAYVNFADHLRSDPTIASLTFVNIAREVGRRWQTMDAGPKQEWENQAAQVMQAYEDQMDAYRTTKPFQDYQTYLETFKKAPGKSARQKIKGSTASGLTSPRRSESSGPDRSPSIDSPSSSTVDRVDNGMRNECKQTLSAAILELSRFNHDFSTDEPYTLWNPPPEAPIRHTITALMEGGGTIFHIIGAPKAEDLINRVYHLSQSPDALSLVELCVIAAVGGHFTQEIMPARLQRRLFVTVCTLMGKLVFTEQSYLRLMRIFLCLTMYSIVEKYLSARSFIAAGLAIARYRYPQMKRSSSCEEWKKVYRTLVFTECWLSQTLGFTAQNLNAHVQNAVEPALSEGSIENVIQWQAARIAIIGSEITTATRQSENVSAGVVRYLASQLDLWQKELPQELQLGTMLSSQGSNYGAHNERAMLIVHVFYLGSVILLYSQPLMAAENSARGYVETLDLQQYRSTCLTAGEQIARLLSVVTGNETWAPRCWLIIYCAFSACNVLLFGAALALRNRSTNEHDRLISHAHACLSTLQACASGEPVAARYLDTITPIYEGLRRLRESPHVDFVRRKSEHKISIHDLLSKESETVTEKWCGVDRELPGLMGMVTGLLKDPFGRVQESSTQPYPTPPSPTDALFWFR